MVKTTIEFRFRRMPKDQLAVIRVWARRNRCKVNAGKYLQTSLCEDYNGTVTVPMTKGLMDMQPVYAELKDIIGLYRDS